MRENIVARKREENLGKEVQVVQIEEVEVLNEDDKKVLEEAKNKMILIPRNMKGKKVFNKI